MTEREIIRYIEERLAYLFYCATGSDYDWGQFVALRDLKDEILKKKGKPMRKILSSKNTEVLVMDEPGAGGANHEYRIDQRLNSTTCQNTLCRITFQNGPIAEAGVNGVMNEDLLAILIDRMRGFQAGNYSCRENAIALTKLEEALMWLNKRTNDRIARGVEGTSIK